MVTPVNPKSWPKSGCTQLLLSTQTLRLRMDSQQGQLPAGSAERLAAWRKPELGATLRTDVLAYLALPFQLYQRRVYKSVPGVEPVGYIVLYVPGPDGVVLLLDVDLDGVPDLCGMWHGGSSQTLGADQVAAIVCAHFVAVRQA